MGNFQKITKMRYARVIESLKDGYVAKTVVSSFLWLFAILQDMFSTNEELLLLLIIVIIVDWLTGNVNAYRKGKRIVSFGWRQSVIKAIEYAVFLFVLTGIANVFSTIEGSGWVAEMFRSTENLEVFGYFYIICTELKSIAENITGKEGTLNKLIEEIKKKVFDKNVDL